jgi:hypothetical protein
MKATMQWRGRKLLCNGVCVAAIWTSSAAMPFGAECGCYNATDGSQSRPTVRPMRTEKAARRAINRRFRLPVDFGAKP